MINKDFNKINKTTLYATYYTLTMKIKKIDNMINEIENNTDELNKQNNETIKNLNLEKEKLKEFIEIIINEIEKRK